MTFPKPNLSSRILLACAVIPLQAVSTFAQVVNPIIDWNRTLLSVVRTPNVQPVTMHSTRSFAMMHLAMEDAVATFATDRPEAEVLQKVAAVAAAHRVLVALYPEMAASLNQTYQSSLASIAATPKVRDVLDAAAVGRRSADRILRARANDGSNSAVDQYVFGSDPGDYQSTPPNFPRQPQFVQWGKVLPFSLRSPSQFQPGPPPALDSPLYARSLNEVQSLGVLGSSTATPDQMVIGSSGMGRFKTIGTRSLNLWLWNEA